MPTLAARRYDLGNGASIETDINVTFRQVAGASLLQIPDPDFPATDPYYADIKGTLRTFRPANPATMQVTANYTVGSRQPCNVGFRQVGCVKYDAAVYSGTQPSEGSLTAHTSGMNGTWMLDCAATISGLSIRAVDVPFYTTRTLSPPGTRKQIQMEDIPGQQPVFAQRRNHKRDRLNYLVKVSQRYDFFTFVVVEVPGGKHIPVKGFSWYYERNIDVIWAKYYPKVAADNGSNSFDSWLDPPSTGDPRLNLLSNPNISASTTLVAKYVQAKFAIQSGSSPDYAVDEYDDFSIEATAATNSRPGWFSES